MASTIFLLFVCFFFHSFSVAEHNNTVKVNTVEVTPTKQNTTVTVAQKLVVPCVCGVFLSGQLDKSSKEPKGNAVFMHEHDDNFICNAIGNKQCINKCLDMVVKHLANSPTLICGAIDRDCYRERAYLFVKNCNDLWINTNLSAGREFCCKNGEPYKCPLL